MKPEHIKVEYKMEVAEVRLLIRIEKAAEELYKNLLF